MRSAFSACVFLSVVSLAAGCAKAVSPGNASLQPITARATENDTSNPALEISSSPEAKAADPCAGSSSEACGAAEDTELQSIKGLPGYSDAGSTETQAAVLDDKSVAEGYSYHGETITEDTEWRGSVTVQGALTVAPQATLTIDPGTVVEFKNSRTGENSAVLLVQGRLAAQGTEDQPISLKAAPGEGWRGILFLASEKKNVLENCRIEGAETGVDAEYSNITAKNTLFSGCRTGVRVKNGLLYVRGGKTYKCGLGIGVYDSEAEIESVSLSSNNSGLFSRKSSIYLSASNFTNTVEKALSAEGSKVKIVKNRFERNGSGISLSSCEGGVTGNGIVENRDYGISIAGSLVKVNANDISRNTGIGILAGDGKGLAWGNVISSNGRYDLYNAGTEDFLAIGNWWKDGHLPGRIYDRSANGKKGKVIYFPVLKDKPDTVP